MKGLVIALAGLLALVEFVLGPAHAQSLPRVKIGLVNVATVIPIYVAQDKGFFREEGLDAEIIVFSASVPIIAALAAGDLDFGNVAYSGAVFNVAAKGQIKIISGATRDGPGFHLNAIVATQSAYDRGFTKVTELPRFRFSTTTVGGTTDYVVGVLAKKYGFDAKKVEMVPLQTLENQNAAFRGNQIDGVMISGIFANRMEADGVGKIIAWTGDELTWPVGGTITRPSMIKENPDYVAKFVRAYQRSVNLYKAAVQRTPQGDLIKGPGFEEIIAIASKNLKLESAAIEPVLVDFYPNAEFDMNGMKDQLSFFQGLGQVDKNATIETMVDMSFVLKK
jgi:NitT/TauT family transport system substrate-binding protein